MLTLSCRSSRPEVELAAEDLERRVEAAFRRPVRTLLAPGTGFHGRTTVSSDGTPVVHIDPKADRGVTRVHELFHLLDLAEGTPRLKYRIPLTWDRGRSREVVWLESQLRGAIQHAGFYGRMREMGLDPDAVLRREVGEVVTGDRPLPMDLGVAAPERRLVVLALRVHLECSDPYLEKRFQGWFVSRVSGASADLVRRAIGRLDETRERSELDRFVACLELLFEGEGTWQVAGRDVEKRGSFRQPTATLEFRPLLEGVAAGPPVVDGP